MHILNAKLFSPRSLDLPEEKRAFVQLLCRVDARIRPQKYGYWEPLRLPFAKESAAEVLAGWPRSLFVTRKGPRVDIDVWSARGGLPPVHANVSVRAESGRQLVSPIEEFTLETATRFVADFGLLHVIADQEYARGLASESVSCYSRQGKKNFTLSSHELRRFLPDLYWGTVFGQPYVELFGQKRLLSAPAYVVRQLDYGAVYLQLSESPYDFIDGYDRLEAIRDQVKKHLGENAFFDPDLPRSHKYDVPVFHLDNEKYPGDPYK